MYIQIKVNIIQLIYIDNVDACEVIAYKAKSGPL